VGLILVFSTFIDWTSIFDIYHFYIDYLKDLLEKSCDFICKSIKDCCCKKEKEKEKGKGKEKGKEKEKEKEKGKEKGIR
jgi:hypothetical protein